MTYMTDKASESMDTSEHGAKPSAELEDADCNGHAPVAAHEENGVTEVSKSSYDRAYSCSYDV